MTAITGRLGLLARELLMRIPLDLRDDNDRNAFTEDPGYASARR